MYTEIQPRISEKIPMRACSDTLYYKSQGALEQDPDNWRNCSIFLPTVISLSYSPSLSPFLLRFFSCVIFSGRETALALLEDQAGWMLLSWVERGSCRIHCYIDTPELTWKLKTKQKKAKILSMLLRKTLNYDSDVTGKKHMMKPTNSLRFRTARKMCISTLCDALTCWDRTVSFFCLLLGKCQPGLACCYLLWRKLQGSLLLYNLD